MTDTFTATPPKPEPKVITAKNSGGLWAAWYEGERLTGACCGHKTEAQALAALIETYTFQATGDETEIYRTDDEDCTPLVLVPFPDGQTIEAHQALVQLIVAGMNAQAIKEA